MIHTHTPVDGFEPRILAVRLLVPDKVTVLVKMPARRTGYEYIYMNLIYIWMNVIY